MSCRKVVPVLANPIIAKSSVVSLLSAVMDADGARTGGTGLDVDGSCTVGIGLSVLLPPKKIERTQKFTINGMIVNNVKAMIFRFVFFILCFVLEIIHSIKCRGEGEEDDDDIPPFNCPGDKCTYVMLQPLPSLDLGRCLACAVCCCMLFAFLLMSAIAFSLSREEENLYRLLPGRSSHFFDSQRFWCHAASTLTRTPAIQTNIKQTSNKHHHGKIITPAYRIDYFHRSGQW